MKYVPRFEDFLLEEFAQNGRSNSTLRILTLFSTSIFSVSFFFFSTWLHYWSRFHMWLIEWWCCTTQCSAVCQKWGEILFHGIFSFLRVCVLTNYAWKIKKNESIEIVERRVHRNKNVPNWFLDYLTVPFSSQIVMP